MRNVHIWKIKRIVFKCFINGEVKKKVTKFDGEYFY